MVDGCPVHVKSHVISALPLGLCWALAGYPVPALVAMGAAVLTDTDHVIDYVLTQGKIASLKTMRTAYETFNIPKNYFFFHSWEFVFLTAIVAQMVHWPPLWALLSGWSLHLLLDQAYNGHCLGRYNVKPFFYFLCFRWRLDFEVLPLRKSYDREDERS